MFVLVTDFGLTGPYIGQVHAVLAARAPGVPVINLFADLPTFDPRASAYLVAAYSRNFPLSSVFLCVVDPGVGGDREILLLKSRSGWFLGPDNGLLAITARRDAGACSVWRLLWRPPSCSSTFHGRDVIAPVAAMIATGQFPPAEAMPVDAMVGFGWPDDLAEIVYIDHYGNAMTGMRADQLTSTTHISIKGSPVPYARTFRDVALGMPVCYENANGLIEIAVNQGRADLDLGLRVGTPVSIAGVPA